MQEKKIALNFTSAHLSELDSKDQELIANAKEAFITAYAPYSGFLVGASILLEMVRLLMVVIKKMSPTHLGFVLKG